MGRKAVPWKNVSPEMEQIQFIKSWEQGSGSFVELCRAFDISRKTGYKRVQRFKAWSWEGLGDQSRAPHSHPNQTDRGVAERIIAARLEHPTWGPKKLVAWLRNREPDVPWPAHSTSRGPAGPGGAGAKTQGETPPAGPLEPTPCYRGASQRPVVHRLQGLVPCRERGSA